MPVPLTEEIKNHMLFSLEREFEMHEQIYHLREGDDELYRKTYAWIKEQAVGPYRTPIKPTVPPLIERYLREVMEIASTVGGTEHWEKCLIAKKWLDLEVKPYGPSAWIARALEQPMDGEILSWVRYWAEEAVNQYDAPIKTSPTEYRVAKRILALFSLEDRDGPDSN